MEVYTLMAKNAYHKESYFRGQSKFECTLGKRPLDVWGRGGQSAGRYKLRKGGCNRIFPFSINENLLKQVFEICYANSTHMLTKVGVANRQGNTR